MVWHGLILRCSPETLQREINSTLYVPRLSTLHLRLFHWHKHQTLTWNKDWFRHDLVGRVSKTHIVFKNTIIFAVTWQGADWITELFLRLNAETQLECFLHIHNTCYRQFFFCWYILFNQKHSILCKKYATVESAWTCRPLTFLTCIGAMKIRSCDMVLTRLIFSPIPLSV